MFILLEILLVALLAVAVWRLVPDPWGGRLLNVLKAWVTIRAFWLLLAHPVQLEDGTQVVAWQLILEQLQQIEASTFWTFVGLAAGIKFIGILASMYRWVVLLRGQRIELPFRHIFGSFLIGRFIGTFLPSTAGLDGYKLYDASRFSGRTVEATAATVIEKVIGFSGIFLSFLVALPFGKHILDGLLGESANFVSALAVTISLGLITGLMLVLFFPGFIQWFLRNLPLPGKAQLEGLVTRVSNSAAAYRDKKSLVLLAFGLSFIVHFTTAAMYYFTALAIGAAGAEFWAIVFGSSIQIFATVISPFTIAGEGIREAAQYLLLGHMIGPAAAIVSAALGFWAAEALTLLGGVFWWIRPAGYTPAWCRVDGEQVDYEKAAEAALALETEDDRARRAAAPAADVPAFAERLAPSAGFGLGAGILAGLLIGLVETGVIAAGGFGSEAQVLWYGPLAYALVLGAAGLAGGLALAVLPMERGEIRAWVPSLAMVALLVPFGLAITVFRVRRDLYLEQMPPLPVLLGILAAAGGVALFLFFLGPRFFRGRLGAIVRPGVAVGVAALVAVAGFAASLVVSPASPAREAAAPIPESLAARPNLILVMVDTLRADQLSCYGGPVETPAICSLWQDGGTIYDGFSHASWTKPATATLLTSLLPTSHGAMSKPSALPQEVTTLAEAVRGAGYTTGGIVSNINLAPSFGFDQGWDEYTYLAPDYLAGAAESSSKLILYQIARRVWFRVKPGHSVGDFYQNADTVNEVAFGWLDRHRDDRFFLFLHYMDVHDPYFEHPYDGTAIARVENDHPDPGQADEMLRLYRGELAYLDGRFAAFLDRLRELGLYENTVIALTSDHGEEFHEHGGWWHGLTLYGEQLDVPLLVKWASGDAAAAGDARGRVARLIDVAPTLIARAGAEVPETMQGLDLTIGLAERAEKDRFGFAEEDHEGNVLRAVQNEEWKWIEANPGNPRGLPEAELFHRAADRGEANNLLDTQAARVAEMRAHAEAHEQLARSQAVGEEGAAPQLTAQEQEALRALGYIE